MRRLMIANMIALLALCGLTHIALAKDKSVLDTAEHICSFSEEKLNQSVPLKIAKIACDENTLWGKPYINEAGVMVNTGPMEAEKDTLANGQPAWQRVVQYWTEGVGTEGLYRESDIPTDANELTKNAIIRSHIIDVPWSAAFMSYVMKKTGLTSEQFTFDDGHVRYIKPAYHSENAPYVFSAKNPRTTQIEQGDLLCYAREGHQVFGTDGFEIWLSQHYQDSISLKMHCDVVVGVKARKAYLIGGNVVQAVTMRQLNLTKEGIVSAKHFMKPSYLVDVLQRAFSPAVESLGCEPLTGKNCDMNLKDWVVLLKYKKS